MPYVERALQFVLAAGVLIDRAPLDLSIHLAGADGGLAHAYIGSSLVMVAATTLAGCHLFASKTQPENVRERRFFLHPIAGRVGDPQAVLDAFNPFLSSGRRVCRNAFLRGAGRSTADRRGGLGSLLRVCAVCGCKGRF